MLHRPITLPPP